MAYRSTVYKTGLLGESCQENRIYLNQKMPLIATSSTTSTNVVSSSPSGNTVKLCDRPAEKSVRPKQSEFAQFLGPTFGLAEFRDPTMNSQLYFFVIIRFF